MKLGNILQAITTGMVKGNLDKEISGIQMDSRQIKEGDLFVAVKGTQTDGHAYIGKAIEKGATAVVCETLPETLSETVTYIQVNDSEDAVGRLATTFYGDPTSKLDLIGVTGTNGKTTTKELISTVLSQAHNVLYTLGNLNNHIGVPTTLLRLKPEHDLAVIEMGANHPGEIKFLCEIAEPDYGIITNVGKAHLEGFGSFEGVIKTKGELYDFLRKKENSTIFIHHDNPYLMNMSEELDRIYYGTQDGLYINGRITDNSPYLTFEWKAENGNEIHRIQTQLIGEYNFPNALAAITIGHFFGVEAQKIDEALAGYTPQNNRSQLKQTTDNTLIIDAYNANPTSMMAALQNFRNMAVPHKMLLLGDMRELGAESNIEHQKIVDYIKDSNFEQVWLVGEQFAATQHNFKTYANVQEVIKELETQKPKGYTILIKGSNGIKLSSTVEHL